MIFLSSRLPPRTFSQGSRLLRGRRYFSFTKSTSKPTESYYNVVVAYQAKDREESNVFKKGGKKSPARDSPTGEDNYLISKEFGGYVAVGVADGVGGWSEAGYDSSAISRELCRGVKTHFEQAMDKILEEEVQKMLTTLIPGALALLTSSFASVLASPAVEIGGTTACIGIFTPRHTLEVANIGDSWCGLFRDHKLVQETKSQTHNFNTPYQLAKIPRQIVRQAELEGRRYIIDLPSSADVYTWDVRPNDIVMFATDGVTDNVIPADIELFLKDNFDVKAPNLDQIASKFVTEVVKVSKDPNFPLFFAQELSRLTGQKYLGGKEDDITVLIVQVK